MITAVLADDHAAIRAGVRMILETADPPIAVLGETGSAEGAAELAHRARPDVVLLDVRMPGASGLTVIERLRGADAAVLMLTSFALDDYVVSALSAGAAGFLVKTAEPSEIVDAVRRVAAGDAALSPEVLRTVIDRAIAGPRIPKGAPSPQALQGGPTEPLTGRERDVLRLLARGLSNQQIAAELVVAESTVKTHVSHVLTKLGAASRVQAALWWGRHGDA